MVDLILSGHIVFIQTAQSHKLCPSTLIIDLKCSLLSEYMEVCMESVNPEFPAIWYAHNAKGFDEHRRKKIIK